MMRPLAPVSLALEQMGDRVFLGVILRSVLWALACGIALHFLAVGLVREFVAMDGAWGWVRDIVASVGATVVTAWLFVPVAGAIATLYADRVAEAVEQRHYPWFPPAPGAPLLSQVVDALALGARVAALALLALVLALTIPGIGLLCGWVLTGYALGRGLFITVSMRRMSRLDATRVYRAHRTEVVLQGMIVAVGVWIPILNLAVPVLAAAMMVHVLDRLMARPAA